MLRCLNSSIKMANIAITDETGCKSSLIRVYTFCNFKATIYTPYIARVKKNTILFHQKRSDLVYSICSGKIRCLKDILEIANSVNTDQTNSKSSLTSVYPLCHSKNSFYTYSCLSN